jgi:hypothetical protein
MALFAVGNELNHHIGDAQCPECWEEYPEPCRCGGLMHATGGPRKRTRTVTSCSRPAAIDAAAPKINSKRTEPAHFRLVAPCLSSTTRAECVGLSLRCAAISMFASHCEE